MESLDFVKGQEFLLIKECRILLLNWSYYFEIATHYLTLYNIKTKCSFNWRNQLTHIREIPYISGQSLHRAQLLKMLKWPLSSMLMDCNFLLTLELLEYPVRIKLNYQCNILKQVVLLYKNGSKKYPYDMCIVTVN